MTPPHGAYRGFRGLSGEPRSLGYFLSPFNPPNNAAVENFAVDASYYSPLLVCFSCVTAYLKASRPSLPP